MYSSFIHNMHIYITCTYIKCKTSNEILMDKSKATILLYLEIDIIIQPLRATRQHMTKPKTHRISNPKSPES
jgi:hypothetical protein